MQSSPSIIAATAAVAFAAASPAMGAGERERDKLDATRTGVEQVDKNRVPDSLRDRLEELRRQSAEQRDAAIETAREIMADLRTAADRAGEKLDAMGEDARREWNEMSEAVRKYLEEAEVNLEELQTAAADQWNETRKAVADALERAANALQNRDAAPDSPERGNR